jgi:hypothetical protein
MHLLDLLMRFFRPAWIEISPSIVPEQFPPGIMVLRLDQIDIPPGRVVQTERAITSP